MSQKQWNEYKELAAYIAGPVNNNTPRISVEFPELRETVDENTPPLPDDPSKSMSAEDHDEGWTMQQAEVTTTAAHDFLFARADHVSILYPLPCRRAMP